MKVLHLSAGNLYGGVETYLVTIARCRDLCPELQPQFAICFPGRLRDELMAAGVRVHDMGPTRFSRPWTVMRARWRLKQLLHAERFDVAVAHSGWPHALFASVVRKSGIRLAHTLHGQVDRRQWLNRWAARVKPDVVHANSNFIARDAADWFPDVPIRTCSYPVSPVDLPEVMAIRKRLRADLGCGPNTVVILQASRMESWKGQRSHIEALGKLRDHLGWTAWFAGGAQRPEEVAFQTELKSLVNKLGIADRIQFLGQRSDVPQLMAAADIFCQPNEGPEPFGIVFIEALYAGLPVVTSNFGGAAEILDDCCGVLTPAGDTRAVADTLLELILNSGHRAALSAAGPARARVLCDPTRQLYRLCELLKPC